MPSEDDAKHILFILFVDNKNRENKNNCSDILKAELHTWYTSEEKQTSTFFLPVLFLLSLW